MQRRDRVSRPAEMHQTNVLSGPYGPSQAEHPAITTTGCERVLR